MASVDEKNDIEAAQKGRVAVDSNSSNHDDGHAPAGVVEGQAHVVDHAAERSLCWKFDIRLLPVLAVMCAYCAISDKRV